MNGESTESLEEALVEAEVFIRTPELIKFLKQTHKPGFRYYSSYFKTKRPDRIVDAQTLDWCVKPEHLEWSAEFQSNPGLWGGFIRRWREKEIIEHTLEES